MITDKRTAFNLMALYGMPADKKTDSQEIQVYKLENETGTGIISVYPILSGIRVVYNDIHMAYCNQNQKSTENVIEINHCREGRYECMTSGGQCCYMASGDFSIHSSSKALKGSCFPLSHYHGISIFIKPEQLSNELWDVILADEYQQVWLDDSAALVGEENAEAAVDMLASMVTATIYGEEAVTAYSEGSGAYCCEFTQGIATFEFADANVIRGYDETGNEIFSHTYHFIGMEEIRGLYIYQTDDADAGEFTYFCLAPDTMDTTWHIEFRYGSDLDALGKYDEGAYAYWLASGISTDCDAEMIENCIELFCTENLSE